MDYNIITEQYAILKKTAGQEISGSQNRIINLFGERGID